MDLEKVAQNVVGKFTGEGQELVSLRDRQAGCEKLPEALRKNCEEKSKGKKDDKKEAAKGEVPEAFKKEWKNKDKDNDGKENEPKPEFLKEKKSSEMVSLRDRQAGCEKLPEALRENCEKKSKGKKDDGKDKKAAVDLNQLDEEIVDVLHRAGISLNSINRIGKGSSGNVLIEIDEQPLTVKNLLDLKKAGMGALMSTAISFR